MSILIKGIDIPKEATSITIEWWDKDEMQVRIDEFGDHEMSDIIVEIPAPHGRLIDADNIDYDDFWYREGQGFTIAVCQGAQRIIEEQPTIIEAEN